MTKKITTAWLLFFLTFLLASCGPSKGKNDSSADLGGTQGNSNGNGNQQGAPAMRTISSARLPVTITGVPAEYSNVHSLNLSIESAKPFQAKISLVAGSKCEMPTAETPWLESPKVFQSGTIGDDGVYSVCVSLVATDESSGQMIVDFISASWLKDTLAPNLTASLEKVYGPGSSMDSKILFGGGALDAGSGLTTVAYKLTRLSDRACFDSLRQEFNALCSFNSAAGRENWSISIPKKSFTQDGDYSLTLRATDRAGNTGAEVSVSFAWDHTPPPGGDQLVVRAEGEGIRVTWSAPSAGVEALVLRNSTSVSGFVPQSGKRYQVGDFVGEGLEVLYVGKDLEILDLKVEPYKTYGYLLYYTDLAYNYSSAFTASVTYLPSKDFLGLGSAYLVDSKMNLSLSWRPYFSDASSGGNDIKYNIYGARSPTTVFSTPPMIEGGVSSTIQMGWPDGANAHSIWLGVKAQTSTSSLDSNTVAVPVSRKWGVFHRIIGSARLDGEVPEAVRINSPTALARSKNGNIVFTSGFGMIGVLCLETKQDPFCAGREKGRAYSIVGRDGYNDGANEEPAEQASIGDVRDLVFDGAGNLFMTDSKYARIRVVCYDVSQLGACYLKKVGFIYNIVGIGFAGDGASGGSLVSTPIGRPSGLAVDSYGNLFFGDASSFRVRVACFVAGGLICNSNRLEGRIYNIAGTGEFGDGDSTRIAESTPLGLTTSIQIDRDGNLVFSDNSFYRLRILCNVAKDGGLCQGRMTNRIYTVAGNGQFGDGADGSVAVSVSMGAPLDVRSDGFGNFYLSDASFYRVRLLCVNLVEGSACQGRSVGAIYNIIGNGRSVNPADGSPIAGSGFGVPTKFLLDDINNLILFDSSYRVVRAACVSSSGVCAGKQSGAFYRVVGNGESPSPVSGVKAFGAYPGMVNAMTSDQWGNVYWSDLRKNQIFVACSETQAGGYCQGKESGKMYLIAGNGRNEDALNGVSSILTGIGQVDALAIDTFGNVYIGDSSYFRVRILCVDPRVSTYGFCKNRTTMSLYRTVGQVYGGAADGSSNTVADGSGIGAVTALAVDRDGNLYIGDSGYWRIRLVCYNTAVTTYCKNRMTGYVFRYVGTNGTAASGDGPDGVQSSIGSIGKIRGLALDRYANLYAADETYYKVRLVCALAEGNCSGKNIGYSYWLTGGWGKNDTPDGAPLTAAMGAPYGLVLDSADNVFVADYTYRRIRLICKNAAGACAGLAVDSSYRLAGNGLLDVPASNSTAPFLSLQSMGNSCLASGLNDSVILGSIDGSISMITTGGVSTD